MCVNTHIANMVSLKLLVDNRERSLFEYFDAVPESSTIIQKETLTTADYAFVTEDSVLEIFERKSLKDYSDSFKDGRHENKNKLLSMRDKTGCLIYYIVEGIAPKDHSEKIHGIKYSAIEASMFNMMSNCGIFVIRTDSAEDTARMFMAKYKALKTSIKNGKFNIKYAVDDPVSMMKEKITLTCDQLVTSMFAELPNVSTVTASEIAKAMTIEEFIFGNRETITKKLTAVRVNGRKLSKTLITNLGILDADQLSKMFSGVPGIKDVDPIVDMLFAGQTIEAFEQLMLGVYNKKRTEKTIKLLRHKVVVE